MNKEKHSFLKNATTDMLAFRYLMYMGMINAFIALIKAFERVPQYFDESFSSIMTKLLFVMEPYGKVFLAAVLLIFFKVWAHKAKPKQKSTLLDIWGITFVGVQIYYYIEVNFYEKTLKDYLSLASSKAYDAFYASTHGFKYTPLFVGIMFGIAITGIMLHDKYVKTAALILCAIYLFLFGFSDIARISFRGTTVGIVLSSAYFHTVQTLGIFLLGLYLELRYGKREIQLTDNLTN